MIVKVQAKLFVQFPFIVHKDKVNILNTTLFH